MGKGKSKTSWPHFVAFYVLRDEQERHRVYRVRKEERPLRYEGMISILFKLS